MPLTMKIVSRDGEWAPSTRVTPSGSSVASTDFVLQIQSGTVYAAMQWRPSLNLIMRFLGQERSVHDEYGTPFPVVFQWPVIFPTAVTETGFISRGILFLVSIYSNGYGTRLGFPVSLCHKH